MPALLVVFHPSLAVCLALLWNALFLSTCGAAPRATCLGEFRSVSRTSLLHWYCCRLLPAVVCCLLQIRSIDYMQTKVKQPSSKAIYRLVAMDLFGTDTKASHVSRTFQLPATGVLQLGACMQVEH